MDTHNITASFIDTTYANIKAMKGGRLPYLLTNAPIIRAIIEWFIAKDDRERSADWMKMMGYRYYPSFIDKGMVAGRDRIIASMYPSAYRAERFAINSLFSGKYDEVEDYVRRGDGGLHALMSAAYYYGDVRGFGLCRLTRTDREVNYETAGFLNRRMKEDNPSGRQDNLPSPEMIHAAVTPEMIPFIDGTTSDVCCVVYEFIANIISRYDAAMIDHYIPPASPSTPPNLFTITTTATDITWIDIPGLIWGAVYVLSRGYPISRHMVRCLCDNGHVECVVILRGTRSTYGMMHKQSALTGIRRCSDVYKAIECVTATKDGYVHVSKVHEMHCRLRMPVPKEHRGVFSDVLIVVSG